MIKETILRGARFAIEKWTTKGTTLEGCVFLFFLILTVLMSSMTFISCSNTKVSKGSNYIKECSYLSGQENTFIGKWESPPVKLSFASGQFSGGEVAQIVAGVNTWNDFYSVIRGFQMFNVNTSESSVNQTAPQCTGSTLSDGVVIYKRTSWSKDAGIVAVTSHCKTVGGSATHFFNAIMEFNYVNFFNSTKNADLQTFATHELGHLLGLDHACGQVAGGKSVIGCPDPNSSDDLNVAVMNPTIYFDSGGSSEIKRELQTNDQQRGSCLY